MSGAPRVRSMNVADSETRPVLGPAGNKAGSLSARKPASKPLRKVEKSPVEVTSPEGRKPLPSSTITSLSPKSHSVTVSSVLRRHEQLLQSSLSLNASCSSDASTDSFHSRASTGRLIRSNSVGSRRKQFPMKPRSVVSDGGLDSPPPDGSQTKKRCAWVTPNTDPCYAAFHDEEWGIPVHEDKKLFELLVFSGALAELTWPAILCKRHTFRDVFADFDPVAVAELNEKKIIAPGSTASSLLSELKLRAIIENARQISKVIDEFGSFDKYIWGFVNYKPIVSRFRYPRQVPVKTPKADVISKDLVRRGFRSVGPTVIYSFMQVAGITNDHLISCYRFQECVTVAERKEGNDIMDKPEDKKVNGVMESELSKAIDELNFSAEF
ncbi:Adenine_glyco domain-containing protein [Cephalotus follicularis]|uniref:Adenine_glyco domain-containing protein n=1 Tax=Cephalotus follicularis TaxID=3775 RepID=A0A1Q3CSL3_CEPFO|nr:Adenine_glyco domain-containing protein [Cephalotus follicularis]